MKERLIKIYIFIFLSNKSVSINKKMPDRIIVKISMAERIEKELEILYKKLNDLKKKGKKKLIDETNLKIEKLQDELDNV